MKNISIFKRLFIITVFCAVVFSGCGEDSSAQKSIVVTDIPSQYNGSYGATLLYRTSDGVPVAISNTAPISNGKVTTVLYDLNDKPFTESGTYIFGFGISDSATAAAHWSGGIVSKSITSETTTISFRDIQPQ